MQLFDSVGMYVFVFCLYALVGLQKLHELSKSPAVAITTRLSIREILLTLITICMAVCLIGLLRKTSSRIEQAVIILTEVLCVLWLANLLARFGIAWADIPHGRYLTATVDCVAAALIGVRTLQIARHGKRTQSG